MHDSYATALTNVISSGTSEATAVENMVTYLKREGKMKMLPGIVRALKKHAARGAKLAPVVEVAHQSEASAALTEAKAHGIVAAHAVVNHDLVSGWRAHASGKLVDQSGKRMLTDIYQNVVAGK